MRRLEAENAGLIEALSQSADDLVAQELADRMRRCRADRLHRRAKPVANYVEAVQAGPQYKCKTICCFACRLAHVRRKKQEAATLFKGAVNGDCSLLTVNAAETVGSLEDVSEAQRLFRFGLNNFRDAAARHDRRFNRLSLYAVLEVQHHDGMWLPHWHIVAWHPLIDRQVLAQLAREQWPGIRRVQAQAFDISKPVTENVQDCIGYATKFDHWAWPSLRSASLFVWVRRRRALRSMCSVVSPRYRALVDQAVPVQDDECLPMPVVISTRSYSPTWSRL